MVKDLAKKTVLATNAKLTRHYMYENYGKWLKHSAKCCFVVALKNIF